MVALLEIAGYVCKQWGSKGPGHHSMLYTQLHSPELHVLWLEMMMIPALFWSVSSKETWFLSLVPVLCLRQSLPSNIWNTYIPVYCYLPPNFAASFKKKQPREGPSYSNSPTICKSDLAKKKQFWWGTPQALQRTNHSSTSPTKIQIEQPSTLLETKMRGSGIRQVRLRS